MKAIEIQEELNKYLATNRKKRDLTWYVKAIKILNKLNAQRKIEGISVLTLPNIEERYLSLLNAVQTEEQKQVFALYNKYKEIYYTPLDELEKNLNVYLGDKTKVVELMSYVKSII